MTHSQAEGLKWAALVSMVIDHVGAVLWPEVIEFRMVGRLALPAFLVVLAARLEAGADGERLVSRLLVWGGVSQLPYLVAFGQGVQLNILLTLAGGVSLFSLVTGRAARPALAVVVSIGAALLGEGGALVVLAVPLVVFLDGLGRGLGLAVVVLVVNAVFPPLVWLAAFLGAFIAVLWPAVSVSRLRPAWAFYAFYPAHLVMVALVGRWIGV